MYTASEVENGCSGADCLDLDRSSECWKPAAPGLYPVKNARHGSDRKRLSRTEKVIAEIDKRLESEEEGKPFSKKLEQVQDELKCHPRKPGNRIHLAQDETDIT